MRRPVAVLLALAALLLGPTGAASYAAPAVEPAAAAATVYAPSDAPLGTSWAEWTAAYNAWFQEIPVRNNPVVDPESPRNCEVVDGVTMIGPSGAGRGCDVAAGLPVMFGLMGYSCSTAEGNGRTWRALTRCVKQNYRELLGHVHLRVEIDGRRLDDPRRWTFLTAHRVIDFPGKNLWGVEGGPTRGLGKGVYLMLAPVAAGDHVVRATLKDRGTTTVVKFRFTAH